MSPVRAVIGNRVSVPSSANRPPIVVTGRDGQQPGRTSVGARPPTVVSDCVMVITSLR